MTDARVPGSGRRPVYDSGICAAKSRRFLLVTAILASSMGFIDGSVVAIALPAIRDTLGASLLQAQWINNAYLLCLGALILAGGALGDRFGLPRVFGLGIAGFTLASAVCAMAPGPATLIVARAAQGIGAALMVPGSLALIARAYPREERGRAIGIWAAASALTTAAGPVIGGGALGLIGPGAWRLVFAVNLPLGVLALWLLHRHANEGRRDAGAPVDIPGAALATGGLLLLAAGLSGAETAGVLRWDLAAAGLGVFALFLWWQARAAAPMMPLWLFRERGFAAANLLSFLLYFALSTMLFYLPMALIGTWGVSALAASAAFAPLSLFIFALSARAGALADRTGPALPIAAGCLLVALGYGLIAATAPLMAYWSLVLPSMAVAGLGMALVVAPLSTAVMGAVPEARSGTASGVNNAVTRVAGLVAVALMGSVAAASYAATGGAASFAETGTDAGHVAATTRALQVLAAISSALAACGALVAWRGLRPDQASSSASQ